MKFSKDHVIYVELVHPHRASALVNAGAGAVITLVSIVAGIMAFSALLATSRPLLDSGHYSGIDQAVLAVEREFGLGPRVSGAVKSELFMLTLSFLMAVICSIYFAIDAFAQIGLKVACQAFFELRGIGKPDDAPDKLSSGEAQDVIETRLRQHIPYANNISEKDPIVGVFGRNVRRLSPAATRVTSRTWERLSNWIGKTVSDLLRITGVTVVFVVTLLLIDEHFQTGLWVNVAEFVRLSGLAASFWPGLDGIPILYLLLVGMTAVFRLIDYVVTSMLVPSSTWPIDSLKVNNRAVAATSPHLIAEEFPKRMDTRRTAERPNWDYVFYGSFRPGSVIQGSVRDTGDFASNGLIEQRPRSIRSPNERAAWFSLMISWVLIFGGLFILLLFLLPASVRDAIDLRHVESTMSTLTPIRILITAIIGCKMYWYGRMLRREAMTLFQSYWFVGPVVSCHITGTTSRSELKVGRAKSDTIETTTTVFRSELLYNLSSAMALSEAATLHGERHVIGLWNDDESQTLLGQSAAEMEEILSRGAAPVTIDLRSEGLREQIEANMAVEALRERQSQALRMEWRSYKAGKTKLPRDQED